MCVGVLLTGCHGPRAAVVVLHADEGRHTGGGAQTLGQVGGSRVVGMHPVLRGHTVAREAAVPMRHLLYTKKKVIQCRIRETIASFMF